MKYIVDVNGERLEVELDAYDAQRLCFMRVSTANPGTTLEQAQRLCPL